MDILILHAVGDPLSVRRTTLQSFWLLKYTPERVIADNGFGQVRQLGSPKGIGAAIDHVRERCAHTVSSWRGGVGSSLGPNREGALFRSASDSAPGW
jgi:hypothetical protein